MEFGVKRSSLIQGLVMIFVGIGIVVTTLIIAKYFHPYLWLKYVRSKDYAPMLFSGGALIFGGIYQYLSRKRMKMVITSTGIDYIGPIPYMDKFISYTDYRIREVDGRKLQELKLPYGIDDFDNQEELFKQIGNLSELYLKERGLLLERPSN